MRKHRRRARFKTFLSHTQTYLPGRLRLAQDPLVGKASSLARSSRPRIVPSTLLDRLAPDLRSYRRAATVRIVGGVGHSKQVNAACCMGRFLAAEERKTSCASFLLGRESCSKLQPHSFDAIPRSLYCRSTDQALVARCDVRPVVLIDHRYALAIPLASVYPF